MLADSMSERRWFVMDGAGERSGPSTTTEVIRALLDERIQADTKLCAEGTDSWREAQSIDEFRIAAKAVRATAQRRLSSRPPADYVKAALEDDDEDEVKTKYFTPGEDASRLASASTRRDEDDDEEEVRTRYFAPGAGDVRPAVPQPAAVKPVVPRAAPPPVPAARAAVRPAPGARAAPPPVPSARAVPPPRAQLPVSDSDEEEVKTRYFQPAVPNAASRSEPQDDEEEVKTRYFQPGVGDTAPRSLGSAAAPDDEEEVRTRYFQPGAAKPPPQASPASPPLAAPAVRHAPPVPPNPAVRPAIPVQAGPAPAPIVPQPYVQAGLAPLPPPPARPATEVGPNAMTVMMPAVRPQRASIVLIIAGLGAFLIALLVASGVAYLALSKP